MNNKIRSCFFLIYRNAKLANMKYVYNSEGYNPNVNSLPNLQPTKQIEVNFEYLCYAPS